MRWWTLFNDDMLTVLERRAQVGNLGLQIAFERIEQSRAQLGITSAQLLPTFSAEAGYTRSAISKHGKFAALGAPIDPGNFWQIGSDASWEIDLWGRARRARESATATLKATVYDREAARVALSAEVAQTYLKLRGTQAQLGIARQNLEIAERLLGLVENRERYGVATRFETASAREQLATVKASIPALADQRNKLMNALALLLGEKPRALDAQLVNAMPLPSLPADVPVGVSSELARRRPDIRRAEARLHAATAAIGVAKADFYPRISLSGRVGVAAFDISDLDGWDSRLFSVGPTIYLPIFEGGRLKQRLALTEAKQKTAAIMYRQTVLQAWHEVDNALDAWTAEQHRHHYLRISWTHNQQALHAAEQSYRQGAANYLSVLSAQRHLLASQTSLNTSATSAAIALVNLYKALGGGWNPDAPGAELEAANTVVPVKPSSPGTPVVMAATPTAQQSTVGP
jgi:NodT family efflux transporter outer membrane factor (OMF) lipoprotein